MIYTDTEHDGTLTVIHDGIHDLSITINLDRMIAIESPTKLTINQTRRLVILLEYIIDCVL